MSEAMDNLIEDIHFLNQVNALHRKGFCLRELSMQNVMDHFLEEAHELAGSPTDISEAGDVLAVFLQICHRNRWTFEAVATAEREKLRQRLTVPIEGGCNGFADTITGRQ